MASEIQVFDFFTNKCPGDQRQAHQFIPFVYGKLSAKGIQWILNEKEIPTPMVNPLTIMAALSDERMQEKVSAEYRTQLHSFLVDLAAWEKAQVAISNDLDNIQDPQKLADELAAHQLKEPQEPVLIMPEEKDYKCKPSEHIKMDKVFRRRN